MGSFSPGALRRSSAAPSLVGISGSVPDHDRRQETAMRYSDEREQLRDTLRARFAEGWGPADGGTPEVEEVSKTLAALDLTGVLVPADLGGSGGEILDLAIICLEIGRARLPGPYAESAAAALLVARCTATETRAQVLRRLVAGERVVVAGLDTGEIRMNSGANPTLEGTVEYVFDAHCADRMLIVASNSSGDRFVYLVNAVSGGVRVEPLGGIGSHELCRVHLDGTAVADTEVLCLSREPEAALAELRSVLAVARSAEATGGAERALELAVQHAKDRVQFGQPIGAFQATQFRCVDMLIDVEAMRCATMRAADSLDAGDRERHRLASSSAAFSAEAYIRVTAAGHRVLGALGFSAEYPLHRYTEAAEVGRVAGGGPRSNRARALGQLYPYTPTQIVIGGDIEIPTVEGTCR
jgi:alkylation response protein AidB-like acyl-CoA dehydrogenase